ncbi:hypothetical protein K227x_64210 [Rubripirellula lacrimiformis]|uniref:Uncharacterized protein n=1 Tax=Rubripirellula lacrimiformis TaxID=1930273 RepID=A0A517NLI1_9BACT|nr:hypothetical protein [Rubripirellula lacrimiformis]QDT07991.1 hypothetical protein K227x_64210 [Rubripirellula lacrimiformis]
MSDTTIEISGDARDLEATFDKIEQKQQKQEEGFKSTAKVSQDSSRQIAAANEAAANKGAESYNVVLKELRKQGPEGRKQAAQIEKYLQQTGKAGRRSMQEIIDELGEFDDEAAKVARNASDDLGKVGDKGKEAFGPGAVQQLRQFALGWAGVQKAVGLVTSRIDSMKQAQQDAVNSLEGTQDGNARLLQVSDNAAEFDERRGQADSLAATHGITRQESRELIFNADSSNFLDSADFIAENSQVLGIDAQSTVAGQIPKLFENDPITGEESINATLAAAETSRLNFEQIASALPSAAASAAPTGATADETLATLAVLADKFKSGETASDRIAAFAGKVGLDQGEEATTPEMLAEKTKAEDQRVADEQRKLRALQERQSDAETSLQRAKDDDADESTIADRQTRVDRASRAVNEFDQTKLDRRTIETSEGRESLAGKGLIEAVRQLMDMPEESRRNFLGDSKELNEAYNAMATSLETIEQRRVVIRQARDDSGTEAAPVNRKRAIADADPRLAALRRKQAADNRAEIELEKAESVGEANRQTTRSTVRAESYARGDSALVAESKGAMQGVANTASAVSDGVFGTGQYRSLASDASDAMANETFTEEERRKFAALNYGSTRLDNHQRNAEQPLLTPGETQTYLQTQTGEFVDPSTITPEKQQQATTEIDEAASKTGRMGVLANVVDFMDMFGEREARQRTLIEDPDSAVAAESVDQVPAGFDMQSLRSQAEEWERANAEDASQIVPADAITPPQIATATESEPASERDQTNREILEQQRRANQLAEDNLRVNREVRDRLDKQNEVAQVTADNTRPRPTAKDPSAIQRAAVAASDARAPR